MSKASLESEQNQHWQQPYMRKRNNQRRYGKSKVNMLQV